MDVESYFPTKQVLFNSTITVIPKVTEAWTLKVSCPCFDLAEGNEVVLDLPETAYPPWSANISIKAKLTDTNDKEQEVTLLGWSHYLVLDEKPQEH